MASKTFTIYTSTADPTKVLRNQTQIVLTVTPKDQTKLFTTQTPIAWKVLNFSPASDIPVAVTWTAKPGFDIVGLPGQSTAVADGKTGVVTPVGGGVMWKEAPGTAGVVAARNETTIPRTFELGSVDTSSNFEAFVRFLPTPVKTTISVGSGNMLQAFTVTGYQGGQLLNKTDSDNYIFRSYQDTAQPLDLSATTFLDNTSFLLYTEPNGRLALEAV